MIIPTDPTGDIGHIYSRGVPPHGENAPPARGAEQDKRRGDEVSLSETAQQLQRLRKALDSLPDMRQERVADLEQQLGQGTYRIDEQGLARTLLEAGLL